MYPPRYVQPNYNMYQGGPNGSKFGPKWPVQHRHRSINYFLKGPNNYHSTSTNEEHWCETCDRGFPNSHVLENHKKQHQKCNIDGCQFVAHPKVITKHIQMQHSTGLFKKIANLTKPEEIKKWREERKNRYPTKENIEKKAAEIKEKVDRGEKMGMKQSREHKSFKPDHSTKRKSYGRNNHQQQFKKKFQDSKCSTVPKQQKSTADFVKKPYLPQRDSKLMLPVNNQRTLKPFTGILHLLDDNENDNITETLSNSYTIEDDEYLAEDSNQICNTNSEPVVCGALSSLMCDYESSDNESTHEIESKPNGIINSVKNSNADSNHNKSQSDTIQNNLEKSDDEVRPEKVKTLKIPNLENVTEVLKSNTNAYKETNKDIQRKEDNLVQNCETDNNQIKTPVQSDIVQNNFEMSDDESGPEEVKTIKVPNLQNETETSKSNHTKQKQSNGDIHKKVERTIKHDNTNRRNIVNFKRKIPSTLLEKLLCNEIRQERNIVLQCIRHIVKCNYFEKTVENNNEKHF